MLALRLQVRAAAALTGRLDRAQLGLAAPAVVHEIGGSC